MLVKFLMNSIVKWCIYKDSPNERGTAIITLPFEEKYSWHALIVGTENACVIAWEHVKGNILIVDTSELCQCVVVQFLTEENGYFREIYRRMQNA